ncbi:LAMI_0G10022g1_1 [Lachancea mirantina]|uniref:LAMI_0G10022g1_1 n=1 Tax=Lachancea mirantina TaxID=1230905 RepID=A0A1G4KAH5_9SACH|nr:LAMI_0G10022g1_1 [Lachancea mirantina]
MNVERRSLSRRSTAKKVDYNEKKADEDLVKRLKRLETPSNKKTSETVKKKGSKEKYQQFLNNKSVEWNFIPSLPATFRKHSRFSNILDLEDAFVNIVSDTLMQEGNVMLRRNDHIYMVSEPPGEPYYIGRIMSFECKQEYRELIAASEDFTESFPARYFQLKMNWYYRPRDIQNNALTISSRLLYASLHVDICPIHSFRGKCTVSHRALLGESPEALTEFVVKPNHFYFADLFDRYTLKYYPVWSTRQILTIDPSSSFLIAMSRRIPYIFVEETYPITKVIEKYVLNRPQQITSTSDDDWDQRCGHCSEWCEKSQFLRCDECRMAVHLYCLSPPLERKPAKSVCWICSSCLEKGTAVGQTKREQEIKEEVAQFKIYAAHLENSGKAALAGSLDESHIWFHYLGMKLISCLDDILSPYLGLPYPLKCSRVGTKYQWPDNNLELGSTAKSRSPSPSLIKESRGNAETSELLWVFDTSKISINELDHYMDTCRQYFPPRLSISSETCNFLDAALKALIKTDYNTSDALAYCKNHLSREFLREPTLTSLEVTKFEKAIGKYGSELHPVCKYVGTQPMSMIVRFYYYWKKTESGKEIWGGFKGRGKNKKKQTLKSFSETQNNRRRRERKPSQALKFNDGKPAKEWRHVDDSSFDSDKVSTFKTDFQCMFCSVDYSPLWYRVTGGCDDDNIKTRMITGVNEQTTTSQKGPSRTAKTAQVQNTEKLDALCIRCARLWRRYAIKWQQPMDVLKKLSGRSMNSIREALDKVLEASIDQTSKLPPKLAYEKGLDWELIQDTELVLRQRFEALSDPDRLNKMRRNCSSMHTQLNKLVRRPVGVSDTDVSHLKQELEVYIYKVKEDCVRKERAKRAKDKKISDKCASVKRQGKPAKSSSNKGSKKLSNVEDEKSISPGVKKIKPRISNKSACTIDIPRVATNGTAVLFSNDEKKIGSITFETDFSHLKLSDDLNQALRAQIDFELQKQEFLDIGKSKKQLLSQESEGSRKSYGDFYSISNIGSSSQPLVRFNCVAETVKAYAKLHEQQRQLLLQVSGARSPSLNEFPSIPSSAHSIKAPENKMKIFGQNNVGRSLRKDRNYCCVCLEAFDNSRREGLACANCGLTVHHFCYGAPRSTVIGSAEQGGGSTSKTSKWLCDVCCNDLNPVASTDYKCCLCNAREIDYEGAKGLSDKTIPDALKVTMEGAWCHVICALFNADIAFGQAISFQPITGVKSCLAANQSVRCSVCDLTGGGIIKCSDCGNTFHVTCAQDSNCRLCFEVSDSDETPPDRTHNFLRRGLNLKIKPVTTCCFHGDVASHPNRFPLTYETPSGFRLIELYAKSCKQRGGDVGSTVSMRYQDQKAALSTLAVMRNPISVGMATSSSSTKTFSRMCLKCHSTCSIYWFASLCHSCNMIENNTTSEQDVVPENLTKDYFKEPAQLSEGFCRAMMEGIDEQKLSISLTERSSRKRTASGTNSVKTWAKGGKKAPKMSKVKKEPECADLKSTTPLLQSVVVQHPLPLSKSVPK